MSQICEHGYFPQRIGDGPCEVCEDFADLKAKLAAAQLESEAWRALAEWSGRSDRSVTIGYFAIEATEGGKQLGIARFGQVPAQSAIDLATKLNLLTPKA